MATILGVMLALDKLDCDIPLDRISTHPLENFFGLFRRLLHDCNAFDGLLHAAARNVIVNEILVNERIPATSAGGRTSVEL
jgi:hypothetical protein